MSQAIVRVSSKRGGDPSSAAVSAHQDANDLPLRCRALLTTEGQYRKHTSTQRSAERKFGLGCPLRSSASFAVGRINLVCSDLVKAGVVTIQHIQKALLAGLKVRAGALPDGGGRR